MTITLGQYERCHIPACSTAHHLRKATAARRPAYWWRSNSHYSQTIYPAPVSQRIEKIKVRQLLSPRGGRKSGLKGPSKEVTNAIVEMKQHYPRFCCPRIAQQINLAFGLDLDKDVVRRILATRYRPDPSNSGTYFSTYRRAK